MAVGLDLVEDPPQALALVVGQALGDAVGRAVGDEHDEAAGQRDLLGQPGALGADRVLGDLAEDRLPVLQDLLDPGLALLLDVLGVVLDVTPVEHRVLGRADVDERRLHAGQDVLDPTEVDVAVDLADVVGRAGHLVLDQGPALQHGDLGHAVGDADRHRVAADGPALALGARGAASSSSRRARRRPSSSVRSASTGVTVCDRRRHRRPGCGRRPPLVAALAASLAPAATAATAGRGLAAAAGAGGCWTSSRRRPGRRRPRPPPVAVLVALRDGRRRGGCRRSGACGRVAFSAASPGRPVLGDAIR